MRERLLVLCGVMFNPYFMYYGFKAGIRPAQSIGSVQDWKEQGYEVLLHPIEITEPAFDERSRRGLANRNDCMLNLLNSPIRFIKCR